jgi:LPXTG-site transpeptidase (sortase) family protein
MAQMKNSTRMRQVRLVVAAAAISAALGVFAPATGTASAGIQLQAVQAQPMIPTRIVIERISVDATIEPVGPSNKLIGKGVVEWAAPKNRNVGWHDYSGRFGEGANIVLNGHNNIYGGVFRKLYTLQEGDQIRVSAGDVERVYAVVEVRRVLERGQPIAVRMKNAEPIQPMKDDRLTIVSCWPETGNSHRIIVIARPLS